MKNTTVILGLGSNMGDRRAHLERAIVELSSIIQRLRRSTIYESNALLPENAPESWDMRFLNMAIAGETALSPTALFSAVKSIEEKIGRKNRGHWAPREIDIDILAYGDDVIHLADLSIPHAELLNRDFVLVPLAEIVPDWCYPVVGEYQGKSAAQLVAMKGYALG